MKISFPDHFTFGTSTAAYQIETAVDHDWQGVRTIDDHVFERTTDHEKRHAEDIAIIKSVAPHYRMSLMWSKLQREPWAPLDRDAVKEYHSLLTGLKNNGIGVMMVLHHFANPLWFSKAGGWEKKENIALWYDYAKKLVEEFGEYANLWNTFNEPNLYTSLGWGIGEFPPFTKNIAVARKVIHNIAAAHEHAYNFIKSKYPNKMIGISHSCTIFKGRNLAGSIPATLFDWCMMEYAPSLFKKIDFFGMSYYARIQFDPFPITNITTPKKIKALNLPHDDMWEYYPAGLGECIKRYWKKYRLPIIITENGVCTADDSKRIGALKDYMKEIMQCLDEGIDVRGYYHWSTWDNFEWKLGPTFQFGLYECDLSSKERKRKPSADIYSTLAYKKEIDIE